MTTRTAPTSQGPARASSHGALARLGPLAGPVAIAAAVTVLGGLAVGVPLGLLAALRLPTALGAAAVVLSPFPTAAGAWVGARLAGRTLDDSASRAALGIAGATIPIVLSGLAVLLDLDQAPLSTTVLLPLVGAAVGGWRGAVWAVTGR